MSNVFGYLSDDFLEVIRSFLRFDTYTAVSDHDRRVGSKTDHLKLLLFRVARSHSEDER
jgi:hypothetical protein